MELAENEEVLKAFINRLVDPLLPLGAEDYHTDTTRTNTSAPPSRHNQMAVAKQMHAVVLLYNYYHRKHNPDLPFLDFTSFSKLSVAVKPPMAIFMNRSTQEDEPPAQLSITEEAIKAACETAVALDAAKDVEAWPISKVAVLIVDAQKQNCLLLYGSVTQGVWAPVEKELDERESGKEQEKTGKKRTRDPSSIAQTHDIYQLAYDATGYDKSKLEVVATHVTYSLTKCRSATQLFLMQYNGSIPINKQVPLKFLVDSLQEPLAKELFYGVWETTEVVEYHHMLPYIDFISHWLAGDEVVVDAEVVKKFTERNDTLSSSVKEEQSRTALGEGNVECYQRSSSSSSRKSQPSTDFFTSICQGRDSASKKGSQEIRVRPQQHKKTLAKQSSAGAQSPGEVVVTDSPNSDHHPSIGNQLALFDANANLRPQRNPPESKELQNALVLLQGKRQELHSQICNLEDMLALYEDRIERIRGGGEVALARRCIESILSGDVDVKHGNPSQETGNCNRRVVLPGTSSCEDLEYCCTKNKWRMPRYITMPSSPGKFWSQVVVQGKDLELLHSEGRSERTTPGAARESAAAEMIDKIKTSIMRIN
ncbi:uncharacterized protein LOC127261152 [Andrographis paniculata]|uniref:uncharacterized protein LOC127261152 n=1 Tax=Andrographis paniculata TaxID=175694 RepID=UPI0021E7561B|nr:uncharacterized protein LOC127261152 [Andrographis paniculata]